MSTREEEQAQLLRQGSKAWRTPLLFTAPRSGSCSENRRRFTYRGTWVARHQPPGTDLDVVNSGHCGDRQLPGPGCGRLPTGWAEQPTWRLHLGCRAAFSCFSSSPFVFRSPSVTSDHIFSVLFENKTIGGCGLSLWPDVVSLWEKQKLFPKGMLFPVWGIVILCWLAARRGRPQRGLAVSSFLVVRWLIGPQISPCGQSLWTGTSIHFLITFSLSYWEPLQDVVYFREELLCRHLWKTDSLKIFCDCIQQSTVSLQCGHVILNAPFHVLLQKHFFSYSSDLPWTYSSPASITPVTRITRL